MNSVHQSVMPRFGAARWQRRYRPLGQSFNANAYVNPGSQYTLNFSISPAPSDPDGTSESIQDALGTLPYVSNGAITIAGVTISGSTVSISFAAGINASVLTLGGIEAAIADSMAQSGWQLTPLDTAGLGTTTFSQQFTQAGGFTLNPFAPTTPGGSNWLTSLASGVSMPNFISGGWLPLVLIAAAGLVVYEVM